MRASQLGVSGHRPRRSSDSAPDPSLASRPRATAASRDRAAHREGPAGTSGAHVAVEIDAGAEREVERSPGHRSPDLWLAKTRSGVRPKIARSAGGEYGFFCLAGGGSAI